MTDQDNEIRTTDMPERFQVCVGHSFCWQWCWYAVVKFSTSVLLPDGVCLTLSRPDFVLCLTVTIHPCETCWGWWAGRRSWVDLQTWLLHSYYLHAGTTSDITYSGKTIMQNCQKCYLIRFPFCGTYHSVDPEKNNLCFLCYLNRRAQITSTGGQPQTSAGKVPAPLQRLKRPSTSWGINSLR